MNTFLWLLKREYWEHRGGFLWTPIWTGGVVLLLTVMGVIVGEVTANRANITIGVHLSDITAHMSPDDLVQLGAALNVGLFSLSFPITIALFFVSFFYLIGALYDDRKDRSVLFWKSLPLTDTQTVLSKVVTAILVAPVMSVAASLVLMLGFLLLLSVLAAVHGVNPITTIWMAASPLSVAAKLIAFIPVNALWALPCVGWLLLMSAFAKRAPFLWAVLLPVLVGCFASWFDLMQNLHIPDTSFWRHVVARLLFGVMPGSWMDLSQLEHMKGANTPSDLVNLLSFGAIGEMLTRPRTWIGAVAGVAMIVGAIFMRRRRDEG